MSASRTKQPQSKFVGLIAMVRKKFCNALLARHLNFDPEILIADDLTETES